MLPAQTLAVTADAFSAQYYSPPSMLACKRAMDIVGAAILLLIASPLMAAIITLLMCDGGAPFFAHRRVGKGGREFSCLKFRTMAPDAPQLLAHYLEQQPGAAAEWAKTQKLQHDPRVTTLGKYLRKSSLDELPQLLNVLRGEMSLVGPRPIVAQEAAHYGAAITFYYRMRPGITGLWQVSGRNDVDYPQRVLLDTGYVRHYSLWQDMVILAKTLPAVLRGAGAY